MLNQNLDMQRMNLRMMRAHVEAEARGEAPPEAAIGMSTGFVTVGPQSQQTSTPLPPAALRRFRSIPRRDSSSA